jgi:hypothetical protein
LLSTWLRPVGGDWDDPANWSDGRVPTRADDVFIPFRGITVTHAMSTDDAARSLSSEAAIDLSAGSLTLAPTFPPASSRIDNLFTVSGGTLSLAYTTLSGQGTLRNLGTVNLGVNQNAGGDTLNVVVDNEGLLNDIATTIANDADRPFRNGPDATLHIGGNSSFTSAFTNLGHIQMAGDLTLATGTIVNAPGATLDLGGSAIHGSVDNQGTMTAQYSTITGTTFTNEGTINLDGFVDQLVVSQAAFRNSGTVLLNGGRSTFTVQGGTYEDDGSISGPGTLSLQNITATLTPDQVNAVGSLSFRNSTITSTAILTNLSGFSDSTINADVILHQSMTFSGHTGLEGATTINGGLTVAAGVTLELVGGIDRPATLTVTHSLENNGSIGLTSGDLFIPTVVELTVTGGTLNNGFGATIMTTTPPNEGSGGPRLLNARLANGGTLTIDAGTILTGTVFNHGTINVHGGDLTVDLTSAGTPLDNTPGTITVASGHGFALDGDLVNGGRITLSPDGFFLVNGSLVQRQAGSTPRLSLNGGVLTASGLIDIQRGTLAGPGVVNGNVQVDDFAELDVGGDGFPGVLTINGDYTQSSLATMVIRIANTTPGIGFDQLNITGAATLDGALRVTLIEGFQPQSGDSFTILTFGSRTGTADITGDGPLFTANFDDNDVTLVAN